MMPPVQAVISTYLDKLQQECREKQWRILETRKPAIVNDLQAESTEVQIAFLRTVLADTGALAPSYPGVAEAVLGKTLSSFLGLKDRRFNWLEFRTLGGVVSCLLRRRLPFQPEDLTDMVCSYAQNIKLIHYCFPLASLISAVESGTRNAEVEAAMRKLVPSLLPPDTAPRSAWLAGNSVPATPPPRASVSYAPLLVPSLPLGSVLSCSIPFSPIAVPPRRRNSKRGHFYCGFRGTLLMWFNTVSLRYS